MKLIALPDLHETGIKYLPLISQQLISADYVILVGDLTNGGREIEATHVVKAVQNFNQSILAVPGNWDRQEANDYLSRIGINLHRQHRLINGLAFVGVGGALTSIGQSPTEYSEAAFDNFLSQALVGLDPQIPIVLISHQPPFNTINDTASTGIHLGSRSIRDCIERTQPMLCLTGHIHEGIGIDKIGSTQVINPGPLWQGGYGVIELNSDGIIAVEIRKCAID